MLGIAMDLQHREKLSASNAKMYRQDGTTTARRTPATLPETGDRLVDRRLRFSYLSKRVRDRLQFELKNAERKSNSANEVFLSRIYSMSR